MEYYEYSDLPFERACFSGQQTAEQQTIVYSIHLQADEYSVPQSIALHLAGLQAQVIHGEYEEDKLAR